MRITAIALVIAALTPTARAQENITVELWLNDIQRAALIPLSEPYTGGTSIGAPVETKSRTRIGDNRTIVRSWTEGDKVRVLVFARDRAKKEMQIATRLLGIGATWIVEESANAGAAPVTVIVRGPAPR
jgi:hypothetical protein